MLAYGAFLIVFVAHNGVPTGTALLMGMVMGGLAVTTIGRGRGSVVRIVLDWLPFALVLIVYDISRSLVDVVGLPLHEGDVADLERHLFLGAIPTVWLQQHFYHPASVHWWDALATLVYASHFLATPVVAAVLWVRDRAVWFSYICRVIALAVAGLVTYTLFPEAPPWMAARDGLIDPVARLSSRGWVWLHMGQVDNSRPRTARRREPDRGDAVTACGLCRADRPVHRGTDAQQVALAAGAVPARDGPDPGVHGRALRHRHRRRFRLRVRRRPAGRILGGVAGSTPALSCR